MPQVTTRFSFVLLGVFVLLAGVCARGGVFQRFSPERLANLGYGGVSHLGMYREVITVDSKIVGGLIHSINPTLAGHHDQYD